MVTHKKRLDSWKAIAAFLGRSLRTVQRWHDFNGLPVHHFGGTKGSVFAYEDEIDDWLAGLARGSARSEVQTEDRLKTNRRASQELTATAEGMWETRSVRNIQAITDLYHQAIDIDPANVAALTGLANAMIFSAMNDMVDEAIAFPIAQDALKRIRALQVDWIDAMCPEAWLDLLHNRNWQRAQSGFEEVLRKRPTSSFARAGLAMSKLANGDIDEAVECAWEAWRLNPLVRSLAGILCWMVYLKGDLQRVLDLTAQMKAGIGNGPVIGLVEAQVLALDPEPLSNLNRLEELALNQPQNQFFQGLLGYVYGRAGEKSKAREKLSQLTRWVKTRRESKGYPVALVYLGLGEEQEAITVLEDSFRGGSVWSLGFRWDPILSSLKGQPRFELLLSKIGARDRYQSPTEIGVFRTSDFAGNGAVSRS